MAKVERSELFFEAARRLGLSNHQLDRILAPLEWTLERDPQFFREITGTQLRIASTQPFPPAIPAYRIAYSIDAAVCVLRSIAHIDVLGP